MSRKAAFVSIVVALALSAAAYLLLVERTPPTPTGTLLDFIGGDARALTIKRRDGTIERTEAVGDGSVWQVLYRPAGSDASHAWPASPTQVRSAMRILSTLAPIAVAQPGAEPDADGVAVELLLDDGTTRAMKLGSRMLSGRVLVELTDPGPLRPDLKGKVYWTDGAISQMLVATGLRAWRETTVFPNLGREASRVKLTGAGGTIVLARVGGAWAMREPVAAPADERAVVMLLNALAAMRVTDFGDGDRGLPEPTGNLPPLASLVVESDAREAAGDGFVTRTSIHEAEFAAVVGLAGDQVLVRTRRRSETRGAGGAPEVAAATESAFTTTLAGVAAIPSSPEALVARASCRTRAGDAGGLLIRRGSIERTLARTIDGWAESKHGGERVPLPKEDADAANALVKFLCEAPADAVRLAQPEGWKAAWAIELRTLGGEPLEQTEIAVAPPSTESGPSGTITIRAGSVWRMYASTDAAAIMRRLLP
ncbi:MAG: hypothetical protein ACKVU4_13355 [Phycisphaerales bacterium]